jgi:hypothetical protein
MTIGTYLYEGEPRDIFDVHAWKSYRDKMESEARKHPDRQEAKAEFESADRHLNWLSVRHAQRLAA